MFYVDFKGEQRILVDKHIGISLGKIMKSRGYWISAELGD